MDLTQIGLLAFEAALVASVLLLLFHRRSDWGLTPLFVAMGVFQHMQVVLAGEVYVSVAEGIVVSPGSVVLFTSTLFAVLLVYIHEDAIEARKLIYALVMANISLAILSVLVTMHTTTTDPNQSPHQFLRIMSVGTVCLLIDTILLIVIYEALGYRWFGSFLRILFTTTAVLWTDQLLFATAAFYGEPNLKSIVVSGLIGKSASGLLYSCILWAYVRWRGSAPEERASGYSWDVFRLLSYRQKFDLLGVEYDILEDRVQQRTVELQEANERLQELSRQLISAQETERRNLARELHDEIGQLLTVVKLQMRSAQNQPRDQAVESLNQTIATIDETINQVRSLSLRLRPSILDDLGLQAALEWQAEQLTERTDIRVTFDGNLGVARIPTELETVCFRVAQEAMTNIMRHAEATKVEIRLDYTGTNISMRIQDDGRGFNVTTVKPRRTGGMGLSAMRERVELVQGTLGYESEPGKGTTLTLNCPIEKAVAVP